MKEKKTKTIYIYLFIYFSFAEGFFFPSMVNLKILSKIMIF